MARSADEQQNGKVMAGAPGQNEQVPDPMKERPLLVEDVENETGSVEQSPRNNECQSRWSQRQLQGSPGDDEKPAHEQVEDDGEDPSLVPLTCS